MKNNGNYTIIAILLAYLAFSFIPRLIKPDTRSEEKKIHTEAVIKDIYDNCPAELHNTHNNGELVFCKDMKK